MATSQKRNASNTTPRVEMGTPAYLEKLNGIMSRVFSATQSQVDNLPQGHKVSIKQLTEKVADFLDMPQAQVAQFVAMFIRSYDKCTVQKGRNGGIYRGAVPKKIDHEPRCAACGQKLRKVAEKSTESSSGHKAA